MILIQNGLDDWAWSSRIGARDGGISRLGKNRQLSGESRTYLKDTLGMAVETMPMAVWLPWAGLMQSLGTKYSGPKMERFRCLA